MNPHVSSASQNRSTKNCPKNDEDFHHENQPIKTNKDHENNDTIVENEDEEKQSDERLPPIPDNTIKVKYDGIQESLSSNPNESTRTKTTKNQESKPKCVICGDDALSVHYGVISCEGCKGFFRRIISKKQLPRTCLVDSRCEITPQTRTRCQACRLSKCLMMGMSPDSIILGRRSKAFKDVIENLQLSKSENSNKLLEENSITIDKVNDLKKKNIYHSTLISPYSPYSYDSTRQNMTFTPNDIQIRLKYPKSIQYCQSQDSINLGKNSSYQNEAKYQLNSLKLIDSNIGKNSKIEALTIDSYKNPKAKKSSIIELNPNFNKLNEKNYLHGIHFTIYLWNSFESCILNCFKDDSCDNCQQSGLWTNDLDLRPSMELLASSGRIYSLLMSLEADHQMIWPQDQCDTIVMIINSLISASYDFLDGIKKFLRRIPFIIPLETTDIFKILKKNWIRALIVVLLYLYDSSNNTICRSYPISLNKISHVIGFAPQEQNDMLNFFKKLAECQKSIENPIEHNDLHEDSDGSPKQYETSFQNKDSDEFGKKSDNKMKNFRHYYLFMFVYVLSDISSINDDLKKSSIRKMRAKCERICTKEFDDYRPISNSKNFELIVRSIPMLYIKYKLKYGQRILDAKWLQHIDDDNR